MNEQVWIKYHEYDGVHHYIFTHGLVHRIRSHCLRDFSPHAMPKWCVSVSRFYFCINIHAQSLFLSVFSSDLWSKIIIDSLSALTGTGPYPSFHCMSFPVYNFISRIIIVSWFKSFNFIFQEMNIKWWQPFVIWWLKGKGEESKRNSFFFKNRFIYSTYYCSKMRIRDSILCRHTYTSYYSILQCFT